MTKILVPIDFSDTSLIALDVAYDLAKRANYELILLHVVEDVSHDSINVTGEIKAEGWEEKLFVYKLLQKAKTDLDTLLEENTYADVKMTGLVRVGNAFHGVTTIIDEENVQLIVMGTKGVNTFSEMIIGTNTERVVRYAKVPVLSIHEKPKTTDFKSIVYATSMRDEEEAFSLTLKSIQQIYGCKVHLVRINTPSQFEKDFVIRGAMEDFAKKLNLENYSINIYNDHTTEEGIIRFAEYIGADMIAMTTHGRSGFAHVIAGSIAEEIVNHSKRPVLTYVVK